MSTGDVATLAASIGLRIREIRRAKHLTQAELARRVGIRAGPMNALEKGRHVPSGRVLIALARELAVSVDDLVGRPSPACYVAEGGYDARPVAAELFSALGTPGPGPAGRRMADKLARTVLAIEDAAGAQKRAAVPLYIPFAPTERGIQALVDRVRHLLGVGHGVLFDYLEVIENAGVRVLFCNLPGGCESLACYDHPNGNAFLFVRNRLNVERQLFRLLFELGRVYLYTLERLGPARSDVLLDGMPLDELHAARKFAALFLMPEAGVRATVDQIGIAPDGWTYELVLRLKHRFGVSAESFVIRLEELDCITLGLGLRFKERIRAYYRRHGNAEPGDTRRVLNRNGRIGDLLLAARGRSRDGGEVRALAKALRECGVELER